MLRTAAHRPARAFWPLLGWLVALLLLGLVVRQLLHNWSQIEPGVFEISWGLMLLALAGMTTTLAVSAFAWHRLTIALGGEIPLRAAFRAWGLSILGKYVPGKVFQFLGRAYMYRRHGVHLTPILVGSGVEVALQLTAAGLVGVSAWLLSEVPGMEEQVHLAVLALPVLALAATPPVLRFALSIFGRLTRQPIPTLRLAPRQSLLILGIHGANCLWLGVVFTLFVQALGLGGWSLYPSLTAAMLLSGFAGMVVIFAPGGLGVRDGLLYFFLTALMPDGVAAGAALATRMWTSAAELMFVGACACLGSRAESSNRL